MRFGPGLTELSCGIYILYIYICFLCFFGLEHGLEIDVNYVSKSNKSEHGVVVGFASFVILFVSGFFVFNEMFFLSGSECN
jgi:hypothetical protein